MNTRHLLFSLLITGAFLPAPLTAASGMAGADIEIISIGPAGSPAAPSVASTAPTPARPALDLAPLRTRADSGNAEDQLALGLALLDDRYGKPDPTQAMLWLVKAAARNHLEARTELGRIHRDGRGGVPRNYFEALRHFRSAADAGYQKARIDLGFMYFQGRGVHQDTLEAYVLLNLASPTLQLAPDHEYRDERAALALLEKQLSSEQKELALERMNDARDQSLSELMKRYPGKQGQPPAPMTDPVKK